MALEGNDKTTSGNFGHAGRETMINKNTHFIMEIEPQDNSQTTCPIRRGVSTE